MRRNHSARRVCGTGVSLGASHRAPSSPAAGRSPPDSRFTGPAVESDRRYNVEVVGAGCHDNTGEGRHRASLVSVCLWVEHPLPVGGSWEPLPTPHPHRDLQRKGASHWGCVCPKQKRVMIWCSPLVCEMQSLLLYHICSIQAMLHYFLFCYIKTDGWIH